MPTPTSLKDFLKKNKSRTRRLTTKEADMSEAIRISPEEAHEKVASGKAMLICAYADDAKFDKYFLEGAISLSSFKTKVESLPKNQELIFYCN